jgi:hypothetical protein
MNQIKKAREINNLQMMAGRTGKTGMAVFPGFLS